MRSNERVRISDFAQPAFKANPYALYARMRKEAPICRTRFLGRRAWLITRYEDVLCLLKEERVVKDLPELTFWIHLLAGSVTRHMLNKDDLDHARLRRLVHQAFTPSMVEGLRKRIQKVCDEMLDELERSRHIDLMKDYALPLPLTIMADMLGIPHRDRRLFHRRSRRFISAATIRDVLLAAPDQRLLSYQIRRLVKQRRREPRNDLITGLIRAEEQGQKLSEKELVGTIFFLLIAGYETTVNLIGVGAMALMQDPCERERFEKDPTIRQTAIEELLRYTSPLDIATQRFAREDIALDSFKISRGDALFAVLGSANRDESQFSNPDRLDLTRCPNKHLTFGHGSHFCLGAPLARIDGNIALTTLFRRFPSLHLDKPVKSLRWRKSLIVRGLESLPVSI